MITRTLDHLARPVAAAIHAVQMAAYAQEAALLGVREFPPLNQTVDDIMALDERFLGIVDASGMVVAAISTRQDPDDRSEPRAINIASLVVHPAHQRRGFGRALVKSVIDANPGRTLTVSTGVLNGPALALYAEFGFTEQWRKWMTPGPVEVVGLRRGR